MDNDKIIIEKIKSTIQSNNAFAVLTMKKIYQFQTIEEQHRGDTIEENRVGFSGADANILSSFTEQVLRWESGDKIYHTPLSQKQMDMVRKKMIKYVRQLSQILVESDFDIKDYQKQEKEKITKNSPSTMVWSEPKRVHTKNGYRFLVTAKPDEKFWVEWRENKQDLKDKGMSVSKDEQTGEWEVQWWKPDKKAEKTKVESKLVSTDIDLPVPEGLSYFPFQKAGIKFAMSRKSTFFGDEMGCIDGQSIISIRRNKKTWNIKLNDLYLKFHRLNDRKKWDSSPTYCRVFKDDKKMFGQHKIKNILYKGKKTTLHIKTKSGKELNLTPDHKVLTENNDWIEIQNLEVGIKIFTNGEPVCKICGSSNDIITYRYAKFKGFCKKCMYKHLRTHRNDVYSIKRIGNDGYVYLKGKKYHSHKKYHTGGLAEHIYVMEKHLGREIDFSKEEIHHKNGIRHDNRIENLKLVTRSKHHKIHNKVKNFGDYHHSSGNIIVQIPKDDEIVEIKENGIIDVYDIVMEEPYRNFIANGIVVHNCGKTIQAIGTINTTKKPGKILVVSPNRVKINWRNELQKWLIHDLTISVIKTGDTWVDADIVIINYDLLKNYSKKIRSIKWDFIIIDEGHYLKNTKAKRTQSLFGDNKEMKPVEAKHKLILTGTPILNRPVEGFPLFHYLDPIEFKSFMSYAKKYCDAQHTRWGWDFSGASNTKQLQDKIRSLFMIRRLKSDVLSELPPKQRQVIEIPSNGNKSIVDKENAVTKEYEEKREELRIKAEKAKKLENKEEYNEIIRELQVITDVMFIKMSKVRHETAVAKIPDVCAHLENMFEEGINKVVLFAHHRDVIEEIHKHFKDISVTLVGGMSIDQSEKSINEFQNNDKVKLFIGNIQAAGVGITLTAAHYVVFAELDWVPANMNQAEDRCHRIGQQESVLIQHLVLENSFDARMAQSIIEKQEIIDDILDNEMEK